MFEEVGGQPEDWDPALIGPDVHAVLLIDEIPVAVAELAVDKQATTLLMPVTARRALNELPDDLWTNVNIEFYRDAADCVFKSLDD